MRNQRDRKYTRVCSQGRVDLEPHTKPPIFLPMGHTDNDKYIYHIKDKQGWAPLHFVGNKPLERCKHFPIVELPYILEQTKEYEFSDARNNVFIPVDRHFEREQVCNNLIDSNRRTVQDLRQKNIDGKIVDRYFRYRN